MKQHKRTNNQKANSKEITAINRHGNVRTEKQSSTKNNNKIVCQVSSISHTHPSSVKDFIGKDPPSSSNLSQKINVSKGRCPDLKNQLFLLVHRVFFPLYLRSRKPPSET